MAQQTPHILVVGRDPGLRSEFESALAGIQDFRPVMHFVQDFRHGIEAARSRMPDLVCVEMERDLRLLKAFTEDLAVAAPNAVIAAVYRRDIFGPEDSEGAILIEAMRSRVRDFLRRPLSSNELEQLLSRLLLRDEVGSRQELGRIVSLISNKGGVGKSTVSVNLACALARRYPDRVLLVDASLQLGICAAMLDLEAETSIVDAVRERDRLDETLIRQLSVPHMSGLRLLAAPSDAVEAAEVDEESMSLILSMARRAYDFVIVDTFPMIDAVVMAILDLSDISYFLMQGTVPNVLGASRHLDILEQVGFPGERVKVVLSRNHPNFSGNLHPEDIARRLGRPIDHVMPYSKKILMSVNTGRPYILRASRIFRFGRVIRGIMDEVTGRRAMPAPDQIAPAPPVIPPDAGDAIAGNEGPDGERMQADGRAEAGRDSASKALRDKVRAWRS